MITFLCKPFDGRAVNTIHTWILRYRKDVEKEKERKYK